MQKLDIMRRKRKDSEKIKPYKDHGESQMIISSCFKINITSFRWNAYVLFRNTGGDWAALARFQMTQAWKIKISFKGSFDTEDGQKLQQKLSVPYPLVVITVFHEIVLHHLNKDHDINYVVGAYQG